MTDGLRIFNYETQQIRTVTINDELWFVGKDICDHFGDTNYRRSLARLEEEENKHLEIRDQKSSRKVPLQ